MINITRKQRFLFSILSGILMVISFPFTGSLTPLIFISWVPLLLVEESISKNNFRSGKVFIHAYVTFLIYNIGTTWWIWNASAGGALMAFILNTLLMAIAFFVFHFIKKKVSKKWRILSPDGFPIEFGVSYYTSSEKMYESFEKWKQRYEQQGYYSTIEDGRRIQIPLDELENYCFVSCLDN